MALKLLVDPRTDEILGAQAVGRDGVDKRIDVVATAMAGRLTAGDLADLELAYAPQFGSAKDPSTCSAGSTAPWPTATSRRSSGTSSTPRSRPARRSSTSAAPASTRRGPCPER